MTEIIIIITAATSNMISLEQALEKAKIRNYNKKGVISKAKAVIILYDIIQPHRPTQIH